MVEEFGHTKITTSSLNVYFHHLPVFKVVLVLKVKDQNSTHSVETESFTKFISEHEEYPLGITLEASNKTLLLFRLISGPGRGGSASCLLRVIGEIGGGQSPSFARSYGSHGVVDIDPGAGSGT